MARQYSTTVEYQQPYTAVFNAFQQALTANGMTYGLCKPETGTIHGNSDMSLFSWGEEIHINMGVTPQGTTKVDVSSKCTFPQLIDWGKNKSNVNRILLHVSTHLPR